MPSRRIASAGGRKISEHGGRAVLSISFCTYRPSSRKNSRTFGPMAGKSSMSGLRSATVT
jgi:hypothetical protein